jgi:hypothetical protein
VVPLDAVAQPLSIDVEVTPGSVQIFANGSDQVCACDEEMAHFAEPGECIEIDDIIECHCAPPSCLTAVLSGTGVVQPPSYEVAFPTIDLPAPDPFPSDLVLHIGGCGHPDVAIPLEPFTAPTPTVTAEVADRLVTARWQTDQPAASAYVYFNMGHGAHACHTTASELTYMHYVTVISGIGMNVGVTTFLPVETLSSPNREIRIWRGNGSHALL